MNLGVTELKIEAVSNDETANVEILGNENLQDGENSVTIIVSSKDGENKVTYQIKVNRKEAVEASTKDANKDGYVDSKIFLYIAIGAAVLIALIIVVAYTVKHRNSNEFDEEEEYDYFKEELPKKETEKEVEEIEKYNFDKNRKKGKHF